MNEELVQEQNISDEKRAKAIEYFSNMSDSEKEMLRTYMKEHFNEFQIYPVETLINGFKKVDSAIRAERIESYNKLQEEKARLQREQEVSYVNFNKTR